MALILILESSTEVCSVALSEGGKLNDLEESGEGLNHSRLLTVFAEKILKRNRLNPSEVDAFAVSKGPGSYTGLRIGVSAAKGLCFATGKPLLAISTIDAMASYLAQHPDEFELALDDSTLICPMIDARRMEVYHAVYNKLGKVVNPVSAKIITENSFEELFKKNRIVFFGNGAVKCRKVIGNTNAVFKGPDKASARFMASLAEKYFNSGKYEDVAYFEPFYLKDFIATTPKNKVIK